MQGIGLNDRTIKIWLNHQPATKVKNPCSTIKPFANNNMNPQTEDSQEEFDGNQDEASFAAKKATDIDRESVFIPCSLL